MLTRSWSLQLFQAFDAAVRGLSIGDTTTLEAKGGNWRRDLVFEVPILPSQALSLIVCKCCSKTRR